MALKKESETHTRANNHQTILIIPMLLFINDNLYYKKVIELAMKAKHSVWIGTADIKDLYVIQGKTEKPFLGVLSDLIGKGVEIRLLHAKNLGRTFVMTLIVTHGCLTTWNALCALVYTLNRL